MTCSELVSADVRVSALACSWAWGGRPALRRQSCPVPWVASSLLFTQALGLEPRRYTPCIRTCALGYIPQRHCGIRDGARMNTSAENYSDSTMTARMGFLVRGRETIGLLVLALVISS